MFRLFSAAILAVCFACQFPPQLPGQTADAPTIFYLQNVNANKASEMLENSNLVGKVKVQADNRLNSLIISGSEENVKTVARLIELFDMPIPEDSSRFQLYNAGQMSRLVLNVLQTLLRDSETVRLDYLESENLIAVYGSAADHKKVSETISEFRAHEVESQIATSNSPDHFYVEVALIGNGEILQSKYPNLSPLTQSQQTAFDDLAKLELVTLKNPMLICKTLNCVTPEDPEEPHTPVQSTRAQSRQSQSFSRTLNRQKGLFQNDSTLTQQNRFGMSVSGILAKSQSRLELNVSAQITKLDEKTDVTSNNQINSIIRLKADQYAFLGQGVFDGADCLVLVKVATPPKTAGSTSEIERAELEKRKREAFQRAMQEKMRSDKRGGSRGGRNGRQQDPNEVPQQEQAEQLKRMIRQMMNGGSRSRNAQDMLKMMLQMQGTPESQPHPDE